MTDPLGDRDLDPRHLLGVVLGALVLGGFAAWMAADLVGRWLSFPVVAVLAGVLLFGKESRHEQVVFVGYTIAGLLVLTPVFMILPDALSGSAYGPGAAGLVFMLANAILFLLFGTLAAVVAYATYRYDGGRGLVQRVRAVRRARQQRT